MYLLKFHVPLLKELSICATTQNSIFQSLESLLAETAVLSSLLFKNIMNRTIIRTCSCYAFLWRFRLYQKRKSYTNSHHCERLFRNFTNKYIDCSSSVQDVEYWIMFSHTFEPGFWENFEILKRILSLYHQRQRRNKYTSRLGVYR